MNFFLNLSCSLFILAGVLNAQVNLLTNGDFVASNALVQQAGGSALNGWNLSGGTAGQAHGQGVIGSTTQSSNYVIGSTNAPTGGQLTGARRVFQDVSLQVGSSYNFSINGSNYGGNNSVLFIEYIDALGGNTLNTIQNSGTLLGVNASNNGTVSLQLMLGNFTATSAHVRIGYDVSGHVNNPNAARNYVSFSANNASIALVPEPSSSALIALAGFTLLSRRKR